MNDYSFKLKIADLTIQFYCRNHSESRFLQRVYCQYLKETDKNEKVEVSIYLYRGEEKLRRINEKKFEIYLPSLKKNLLLFNDYFRKIFIYLINRKNGFLLHGSALVEEKKGYIFIGEENSGKSTIRKLFPELVCLGDDSAIVRKVGVTYYLFGSPFYQKTKTVYPNLKISKLNIFALSQFRDNLVVALPFKERVKKVMANTFIQDMGDIQEEKLNLFKNICNFCQRNFVFTLYFRKDRSFKGLLVNAKNIGKRQPSLKLNPKILSGLPKEISWLSGLASAQFLNRCRIIREQSWHFEFDGERRVERLRDIVFGQRISYPHAKIIKELKKGIKRAPNRLNCITLIEKEGIFTILDGNHRAVAISKLVEEGKEGNVSVLIARLTKNSVCKWF